MPSERLLRSETRGAVHWLTIDRPEAQNAVTWALFPQLAAGIEAALANADVRAIVLTGAGDKYFCVGGDLQADLERSQRGLAPDWLTHPLARLFEAVERCGLPIVARVNGHAMAPGLSLLAMCDLAVAVDSARFALPEVKAGMFPMVGLPYLQRLVPRRKLLELAITGEPLSAQEALACGLVNHVVPAAELDAKLDWLLARILDKSPEGIRRGKHAFRALAEMPLREAFAHASASAALMLLTEDLREGIGAVTARRKPAWRKRPTGQE